MRIDVHSHLIFLDYLKYLAGRSSLPTGVLEGGTYFVSCTGGYRHASPLVHADVDAKLRAMEDLGIDMAEYGSPKDSRVWQGLGFHLKQETISFLGLRTGA